MTDNHRNPPSRQGAPQKEQKQLSLVDAVYEVALDPSRYDELVEQWHRELSQAASPSQDSPLAEHFNRASTIFERVHQDDWQATVAPPAMPEILLSRSGAVVKTNAGAQALLSARAGQPIDSLDITPAATAVLLEKCRNLKFSRAPKNSRTAERLRHQTAESDGEVSTLLRIARLGDDRPLVVMLSPSTHDDKPVLVLRCAEIVWPESLSPLLAEAFSLTDAECEIVQAMVAGLSTAQISDTRGTSKETVRTQIRQLLAKTGTHSQLELIRMAIGFSMMSQQAEARAGQSQNAKSHDTRRHENNTQPETLAKGIVKTLANGSDFELVQYGPDDAPPILVFHDEVIGDAFVLPLLRFAPGFRWLVAVRPGYGATSQYASDDPDDETTSAASSAEAFHNTLERIAPNLPAAPLLAHGNGIFFACQFARLYPERCTAITTLSASLPGEKGDNESNRYVAFIDGMRRLAPSMLRFAAQAGFAMYARVGTRRFLERVYGDCEADRQIIDSQQAMIDLEHGGRLTLAQGYRGFYRDEQMLVEDWSDEFVNTPVPVRIVIGDQDQPDRRRRALALQSKSNTVELVDADNAGFFAAFSATKTVTDALLRA